MKNITPWISAFQAEEIAQYPYCSIYLSETYQTEGDRKIFFIVKHVRTGL